jgi:hypothetical protein
VKIVHRNPRTRLICISLFAACLFSVAASSRGFAQQRLTLDWVFGENGRALARVPSFAWLDDGTAVIYDTRRPAAERVAAAPEEGEPGGQAASTADELSRRRARRTG